MASNPQYYDLKNMLNLYYVNFFFDNKNLVSYLQDISSEGGNVFDDTSKKVLSLEINKNGSILFYEDGKTSTLFTRYTKLLYTITEVTQTIYFIIKTNSNYFDIYKMLSEIKLINTVPSAVDIASLNTVADTNTRYYIDGTMLNIYNSDIIPLEFDKNADKINPATNLDNVGIIKNYLKFLISFSDYNLKTQLYAFYYYLIMLNQFFMFYYKSEKLLVSGADGNLCNYFNNMFSINLLELKGAIDALLNTGRESSLFELNTKCISTCPITLNIIYTRADDILYFEKDEQFENNYLVIVDEIAYEVLSSQYEEEKTNYYKKLIGFTLKANSNESSCQSNGSFPTMNITQNHSKRISIRGKTVSDIRRDYIISGNNLRNMNMNIEKSKDIINKTVKEYDKQETINKSLMLRVHIYYFIFACILISYLIIYFGYFDQKIKINFAIAVIFVIVLLIIFNYFFNYDFIEKFQAPSATVTIDTTDCSSLTASSSVARRLNFINNHITIFTEYIAVIITSFNLYLSSLDSIDLFKKLSGSMKNESNTFKEHETLYKYKEKTNKKLVDIMKHDMIYNTAFVNMITFMALIISLFMAAYIYNPEYIKVYLIITGILTFFNLYMYFYSILHPVRTKARNKYWYKLAESVAKVASY